MAPLPPPESPDRPDALDRGRSAYARGEWQDAFRRLSEADAGADLDAEDLWKLGLSGYLTGEGDAFVSALERAHHRHLEAGDPAAAARCAFWVGFHLANAGEPARGSGWLGRAARLLENVDQDCAERGYLGLAAALQCLAAGDADAGFAAAARAVELAQRFGDRDLLALGLHLQGRARIGQARVEEGLGLLDESMVGVAAGELSPQVTGIIYCSMIGACRRVYALGRAHEWTAALTEWCDRQPDLVAYRGECRVYRAEIMQLHGAWREAIEEAKRARERLAPGPSPGAASLAFYQQGEVHRLLGDFDAAEEAYREARALGREPQPGLALLRLAQGSPAAAAAAIRRAVGEIRDPLDRARLLPAHIEIMLATGDIEEARRACAELEEIADALETGVLHVMVAYAQGAVHLAEGEPAAALAPLREALRGWQALDAPYQTARVRMLLGRACRALGDVDTADLETDAARATLDRLGAAPDLQGLDAVTRRRSGRPAHGLTPRELEVLRLIATGRTNRAIATELFISEKTVARHVSNIFTKLGLSTRAAATAFAYEHDLLAPPA